MTDTRRDETRQNETKQDDRRQNETTGDDRQRVIQSNPGPRYREAATLANAVALPVAVQKTQTPIH